MAEANKYDELAEELIIKSKWYKREKRRNKAMEKANRYNKEIPFNNLSKKDEYTVIGWKNGDPKDTFTMPISASSYHGEQKEYEEIKAKARIKEKCTKINILKVVTK